MARSGVPNRAPPGSWACASVVLALAVLTVPGRAADPNLSELKQVNEDEVTSLLLVNTDLYVDPSAIKINVNCEPNKGVLSTEFLEEGLLASDGSLLFKPNTGEYGEDFFTFNVTGQLKPGLTADQINEAQSTKVARLSIVQTNGPPIAPTDNEWEFSVAPGVATAGKMRRGCYNGGTLNANNECRFEFPENPDAILPMTQDMDRDALRFIVTQLPTKGTLEGDMDSPTGDFTYRPEAGILTEWDSFKYKITDCPIGCLPGDDCKTKDPPGCSETGNVTVTVLIGNPSGMRAKSKSYSLTEDKVLQSGNLVNPLDPASGTIDVVLERATFDEAGISAADAAVIQLRWVVINPPANGEVIILGCNETDTYACQEEAVEFIYIPNANFFGQDEFTYRVEDMNTPHPTNELDGSVVISIQGTLDPPLARGGDLNLVMAQVQLSDFENYQEIVLEVEEYDGIAQEMWMIMTSEIVNGSLYESAELDASGNVIAFGPEMQTGTYYNMTKSYIQEIPFGTLYEKRIYYVPPRLTRGLPLDTIRWATMRGTKTGTACSTVVGWVILPGSSCGSSNTISQSSIATTNLVVQCSKGYSVQTGDATKCSSCSNGFYAPGVDLPSCTPCEKGRFSNSETGHEECTRCDKNFYADTIGASLCTPCPSNIDDPFEKTAITDGPGKTSLYDCMCERKNTAVDNPDDFGYYGASGTECRTCPSTGAKCHNNGMTWPVNLEGFYLELNNENHTATASACNNNAACPANDDWFTMMWKPCADGYNGTRCSECWNRCSPTTADGGLYCYPETDDRYEWWNPMRSQYYRFDKDCRQCPKLDMLGMIVGAVIGVVLLAPIIFKLSDAVKNVPSINIGLSFTQVLAIFPKFNIDWPISMTWLWEKMSIFNINIQLLAPECVMEWKWIYTYLFTIITPLFLLFLLMLALAIRFLHSVIARSFGQRLKKAYPVRPCLSNDPLCNYHSMCNDCKGRPKHQRPNPGISGPPAGKGLKFWLSRKRYQLGMLFTKSTKRDQFLDMIKMEVRVFLVFLKIGYIFLASATIGYFDCVGNEVIGTGRYLHADPTLECYNWSLEEGQDDTWPRLFPLAVCMLLLYPIGIVAVSAGLLYGVRKSLDNRTAKSMVGCLYFRFKPHYFYWELCILIRKLSMVLCTVMFSAQTDANGLRQALFGMLALLIALLTHMYAYPYDRKNLNHLESATIAAQFFSLFVGLAFLSDKMSTGFSRFMEICNLIVMAISIFACIYYILLDIFPDFRSKYANFWEKRAEGKKRRERERKRKKAEKAGGMEVSIGGYKKVMEFRWRAALGAKASKLLTATGARILVEFIESERSLDQIINEGRADDKKLLLPVNDTGVELTKKEAVRQCFEELSNFINDDDDLHLAKQERQYIYEVFRPNVRNVILEGLSREDKETTDRLKAFLQMVVNVGGDEDQKEKAGKQGFLGGLGKSGWGRAKSGIERDEPGNDAAIDVPDSDSDDGQDTVMPSDAKPLLSHVKSQAN